MAKTTDEPPRKVVLFSGHMIDAPGREKPRFPPDKEPIAASAIGRRSPTSASTRPISASAAALAAEIFCSRRRRSPDPPGSRSTSPSTRRRFSRSRSTSPTATGARVFSRRRREPRSTFNPANWVRRQQAKTPTSATIVGCSTPPRASARTRSTSSAFGMFDACSAK